MQPRDIDDEPSLNREAAYGRDEPVRDDRNLVEKARDAVVGAPDRTRDDPVTTRTIGGVESDAHRPVSLHRTDTIRTEASPERETRSAESRSGSPGASDSSLGGPMATDDLRTTPRDRSDVAAGNLGDSTRTSAPQPAQNLLPNDSLDRFQTRWQQIQIGFVDEPRTAVRDAEALVGDMVSELTAVFTRERQNLEQHWDSGTDASTEDLRIALQRYRSFFQRLLAA